MSSSQLEVAAYAKLVGDITDQAKQAGLSRFHVVLRKRPATQPSSAQDDCLLTYSQLAERLGTSESWVRRNARRSYTSSPIPSVRLGKNVLFDWSKVQSWLKRREK